MTASAILEGLAQAAPMFLSLIPGGALVAPWVSAGLGLASRAAGMGLTPAHITHIDIDALRARRAEADARLDGLVLERNTQALLRAEADARLEKERASAAATRATYAHAESALAVARGILLADPAKVPDLRADLSAVLLPGAADPPDSLPPGYQKREAEAALNEVRAVLRAGHTSADDLRSDIEDALGGFYPDDLEPGEQGPGTVLP